MIYAADVLPADKGALKLLRNLPGTAITQYLPISMKKTGS
jgi:hypothetical protein